MSRLKPWLPPLAWAALLFALSSDIFSSGHTSEALFPLLRWLLPFASDATLLIVHLLIRKCAHLVEYSIFSWLLFRAVRAPQRGWKLRWAMIALLIAAIYAGLDEFHQSFVPSRSASGWDVLLDTAGAAGAQWAIWKALQRRNISSRTGEGN